MSSQTFPNGTTLNSSALSPQEIELIFQNVTAQILGFNLSTSAAAAYAVVRVGWQSEGQPAWKRNEDVCILTAYPLNEEYSLVRDEQFVQNNSVSLSQNMCYTQVWRIHWTVYGPNSFDRGRLIASAMSLDWVHDYLQNPPPPANTTIYMLPEGARPQYAPELFQGQWWSRTDLDLKFNELVLEDILVSSALTSTVNITTNTGQTRTVVMSEN